MSISAFIERAVKKEILTILNINNVAIVSNSKNYPYPLISCGSGDEKNEDDFEQEERFYITNLFILYRAYYYLNYYVYYNIIIINSLFIYNLFDRHSQLTNSTLIIISI